MLDATKIMTQMNSLIAERRFDEMLDRSEQLIEEYPESYLGRWWKARVYTFIGNTGAALHWFMEAMKKADDDQDDSKICSSIANVYNVIKKWDESLNYTDIALELNPDNVVAVIARSIALMATGKKREASQLLAKKGGLFREEYQKACVAAVMRDKHKMLEHLSKAVKENPHNRVTVLFDPDFALYRNDLDFLAVLKV
jgi:tetratricopeptide (TPR) repeat protein